MPLSLISIFQVPQVSLLPVGNEHLSAIALYQELWRVPEKIWLGFLASYTEYPYWGGNLHMKDGFHFQIPWFGWRATLWSKLNSCETTAPRNSKGRQGNNSCLLQVSVHHRTAQSISHRRHKPSHTSPGSRTHCRGLQLSPKRRASIWNQLMLALMKSLVCSSEPISTWW